MTLRKRPKINQFGKYELSLPADTEYHIDGNGGE